MPRTPQLDLRRREFHPPTERLQQLRHASDRATAALARRLGLTLTDLHAMEHLLSDGDLGPAELARRLEITTASATALVDRLEARGHVVRTEVDGDRRRRDVHATSSGEREAFAALGPLVLALDEAADAMSPVEQQVVADYLDRVVAAYDRFSAAG